MRLAKLSRMQTSRAMVCGRLFAVSLALLVGLGVPLSGCGKQGEGERCDQLSGNDDCQSNLYCVSANDLRDKSTDRCCPGPSQPITDNRCLPGGSIGAGGAAGSGAQDAGDATASGGTSGASEAGETGATGGSSGTSSGGTAGTGGGPRDASSE